MSYEAIATLMFASMMLMLLTGQRVFGAIGFVAVVAAFFLWGDRGGYDLGFAAAIFFQLFVIAGQFIGMQMGLGFAAMVRPVLASDWEVNLFRMKIKIDGSVCQQQGRFSYQGTYS